MIKCYSTSLGVSRKFNKAGRKMHNIQKERSKNVIIAY